MGSEDTEVPALKEEEFAQITILGVHVSVPNGNTLSFVLLLSFDSLPSRNLPISFHRHENSPQGGKDSASVVEIRIVKSCTIIAIIHNL
ncbi:hypothetical protein Tco_0681253 [Tanacetum coccineum]|uniref:Uncharacterized protein n=1 Tax=Tanacetum coccineum TaxID=301880 RepID=A0ABQ4XN44_9ASTR